MKANDILLMDFISKKDTSFYVPPYQRKFKWERKKEIQTLIKDIEHFISETKHPDYFLGSIVVKKKANSRSDYIIIDGQQRITTLFLLCKAIADIVEQDSLKQRVNMVLESNETKFKFNKKDDICILIRILNENDFLSQEESDSNYFKVYKFFKEYLRGKTEEEIDNFFNQGITNIRVALIELQEYEDEFSVYESINSKGKKLTNSELIKNYVMMILENKEKFDLRENFEEKFVNKIHEKDLEDLYRQTLAIKTGELFSKSNNSLYYEWKKKHIKTQIDETLIDDLIHDQEIFNFVKNHKWGSKALPLVEAALMNFYAVIHLSVKANSKFNHGMFEIKNWKNIERVINYLSKLVVARMLYGFGRVESNRSYAKMAQNLDKALLKYDFEDAFQKAIIENLEESHTNARMPKKDEIEIGITKRNVKSNQNVLKWTLVALEQMASGDKSLPNENVYIKNIFPEKLTEKWKQKLNKSELEHSEQLLNTLGNMTISKTSAPVWNKDPENMNLYNDKKLDFKINEVIYKERWNHNAIKNRTKQLLKKIIDTWKIN